ncbi:MAG: hypothetical protein LBU30_04120 [Candidatus Methanoplasma sp.]|jgi:hypothetical protein|nr:hypothetical protein [Candidatus Methanoplasma sp.]
MSDKDRKCTDPDLERFFKENRDMVERLFREEKDLLKNVFEEEKARAEELLEEQKKRAKDATQGVVNMLTDPDVQRHFTAMGIEFMMGINALMKAAPIPDSVRDMADKAEEARKNASEGIRKAGFECGTGSKPASPEKIEIKSVPKKKSKPPVKSDVAADTKTYD